MCVSVCVCVCMWVSTISSWTCKHLVVINVGVPLQYKMKENDLRDKDTQTMKGIAQHHLHLLPPTHTHTHTQSDKVVNKSPPITLIILLYTQNEKKKWT